MNRHHLATIAVAASALAATAAAPGVDPFVLATDAAGDTTGVTAAYDVDERLDIVEVRYSRTGSIATFEVEVADGSDEQLEDAFMRGIDGDVWFSTDGCTYIVSLRGTVHETCDGGRYRDVGRARTDLGVTSPDVYRLSFDLDVAWEKGRGDIRSGAMATDLYVNLHTGQTSVPAPVAGHAGIGCNGCGGQYDAVEGSMAWQL